MKTVFDGYRTISTEGKITYFAGSNTESGFRGIYDDIADEDRMERVYIIKGGKTAFVYHHASACISLRLDEIRSLRDR